MTCWQQCRITRMDCGSEKLWQNERKPHQTNYHWFHRMCSLVRPIEVIHVPTLPVLMLYMAKLLSDRIKNCWSGQINIQLKFCWVADQHTSHYWSVLSQINTWFATKAQQCMPNLTCLVLSHFWQSVFIAIYNMVIHIACTRKIQTFLLFYAFSSVIWPCCIQGSVQFPLTQVLIYLHYRPFADVNVAS